MAPRKLFLAPLQGITDPIVRDMMTQLGGIDGCVSVYARVSVRPLPSHALARLCPEMAQGGRTLSGSAVHLQLLGGDADLLAETARHGIEGGAPVIDLNFGCPMGRVNRRDGGAALLLDLQRLTRIVDTVRRAIPANVPVSAKVRAGWSDTAEAADIAKAVEQGGADLLTMHGRTRQQQYGGHADWDAIARARRAVRIPVIANGDIGRPEDLERCAATTGCNYFMIGRGALARPELFRRLVGLDDAWWPAHQRLKLLMEYGERCSSLGIADSNVVGRVKGWWRYMAGVDRDAAAAFNKARRCTTWAALRQAISQFVAAQRSE